MGSKASEGNGNLSWKRKKNDDMHASKKEGKGEEERQFLQIYSLESVQDIFF